MRKAVLLVLVLVALCAPAAFACDQMCRYDGCVTVGFVTGMACHMNGAICVEDQAYGCWLAEAKLLPAATIVTPPVESPAACFVAQ